MYTEDEDYAEPNYNELRALTRAAMQRARPSDIIESVALALRDSGDHSEFLGYFHAALVARGVCRESLGVDLGGDLN